MSGTTATKLLAVTLRYSGIRRPYWMKTTIKHLGLKRGQVYLFKNSEEICGKLRSISELVEVKHVIIRNYANPYGISRLNDRGELFLGDVADRAGGLESDAVESSGKQAFLTSEK